MEYRTVSQKKCVFTNVNDHTYKNKKEENKQQNSNKISLSARDILNILKSILNLKG